MTLAQTRMYQALAIALIWVAVPAPLWIWAVFALMN